MRFFTSLRTALGNLRANKLRSVLTMLGVIIGVSSVIIMVSIVEGARAQVVEEFQRLGSDLIIVSYGLTPDQWRHTTRRLDGLTMDDVDAIRAQCSLVRNVSADASIGSDMSVRYKDRESQVSPEGVEADYGRIRNYAPVSGRFLSQEDMQDWNKVCVIGDTVRQDLFPDENPVGKEVEVSGVNLTVIGLLERKGRTPNSNEDKVLFMPITTIHKRFMGNERVNVLFAQPRDATQTDAAMEQVWELLMRRYDNAPGFHVDSQENFLKAIGRILTIFGLVVGSIAGLALLVGGIGIMNIMLVSVTERTREIGVRKAIGAKRRDILLQFLIESATVSGLGGLLGIALGVGAAYAVRAVTVHLKIQGPNGSPGLPVHLPSWAVLGAFFFSAFVGLFFGIYPATRAARLDPIQALRHE